MSGNGIHDADTRPARWLYTGEDTFPGEPTDLQEAVELHAMTGMIVAATADISPEIVDVVCAAPAWKPFTSHVYLDNGTLDDDEVRLAQHMARTLVERVGEAYPGDGYEPTHIALMVFYRGVLEGHTKTQGELN